MASKRVVKKGVANFEGHHPTRLRWRNISKGQERKAILLARKWVTRSPAELAAVYRGSASDLKKMAAFAALQQQQRLKRAAAEKEQENDTASS